MSLIERLKQLSDAMREGTFFPQEPVDEGATRTFGDYAAEELVEARAAIINRDNEILRLKSDVNAHRCRWEDKAVELDAKTAEAIALRQDRDEARFVLEALWNGVCLGLPIDAGDVQNNLEARGLLKEVTSDHAFKELWNEETMFVLKWQEPPAAGGGE